MDRYISSVWLNEVDSEEALMRSLRNERFDDYSLQRIFIPDISGITVLEDQDSVFEFVNNRKLWRGFYIKERALVKYDSDNQDEEYLEVDYTIVYLKGELSQAIKAYGMIAKS